jgi:DNA-binding transcriptional ArsR family regulator
MVQLYLMKDIRSDLRERLDSVGTEIADLQSKLSALQARETSLKFLLHEEDERIARDAPTLFPQPSPANGTGLRELVERELRNKQRPANLEEIKADITRTGYNFGEGKPGRAIHGALIGLKQNGVVDRLRDGRWVLKELVQETTH